MRGTPISKVLLHQLYVQKKKSSRIISKELQCSENKVNYWLSKHNISKRSITEAVYTHHNPDGDPFYFKNPKTPQEWFLYGLGLGLYWGEGNRKNEMAVRLGNTDPALIKVFLEFLQKTYSVKKEKMRFGIQIFSDMSVSKEIHFWSRYLNIPKSQFWNPITTPARSIGTYKEKTKHGVLTVYVSNTKFRDLLVHEIEMISKMR